MSHSDPITLVFWQLMPTNYSNSNVHAYVRIDDSCHLLHPASTHCQMTPLWSWASLSHVNYICIASFSSRMPGLSIRADSPVPESQHENGPNVDEPAINETDLRSSSDRRVPSRFSRSRSPRRSRHEHHSHRRRRFRFKHKERNFLAAVCSMIVIVMLCTALVEPDWIYMRGGACSDGDGNPKHTIGVFQFFYPGHFEHVTIDGRSRLVYHYSADRSDGEYIPFFMFWKILFTWSYCKQQIGKSQSWALSFLTNKKAYLQN